MPALLAQLAQGLYAFHLDLEGCAGSTDHNSRVTTVVMSEFGRRLRENESGGTDHGHGSVMFVLGKTVRGGQVYGQWPGLSNGALYQGADLAITTDYRRVLSEILTVRMGRTPTQLGVIFPAYAQQPYLGLMRQPEEPVGARCPNFLYLPTVRR
ncbi:MAG: DUF1501 domain-containing protein [Anaerolineae bacterium]|nr:DUF1501 domain-containing protein [Anaerolineae bacterium]